MCSITNIDTMHHNLFDRDICTEIFPRLAGAGIVNFFSIFFSFLFFLVRLFFFELTQGVQGNICLSMLNLLFPSNKGSTEGCQAAR